MTEMPTISVTELVTAFKQVVEGTLPRVCVQGEVSNFRRSGAGHCYLTLKDEHAEMGAVIWRSTAERLRFQLRDGIKVLATGGLQVYVARGNCQFVIDSLRPDGIGDLELAFRQLKDKLQKEGLFDTERKRPLPKFPRRIALVTSPTSAAVRDMLQVILRRWPGADVIILPVPVQGQGAAPRIAKAIRYLRHMSDVDVAITGRGGGSLEDMWPFNEEVVARAIVECPVPVISAVGHEIDVSIADLVADKRALTPSEAGELVVPSAESLREELRAGQSRMYQSLRHRIERLRSTVDALAARRVMQSPGSFIDEQRLRFDELGDRAARAVRQLLQLKTQRVQALAGQMDALSPLKVLSRGYSLTRAAGQLVTTVDDVSAGDQLVTRTADGTIESTITGIKKDDSA